MIVSIIFINFIDILIDQTSRDSGNSLYHWKHLFGPSDLGIIACARS